MECRTNNRKVKEGNLEKQRITEKRKEEAYGVEMDAQMKMTSGKKGKKVKR